MDFIQTYDIKAAVRLMYECVSFQDQKARLQSCGIQISSRAQMRTALQMFYCEQFLTSCSSHVICIPESKRTTRINLTENLLLGRIAFVRLYIAQSQSRPHIISCNLQCVALAGHKQFVK